MGRKRDNNEDSLSVAQWTEEGDVLHLIVEGIYEDVPKTEDTWAVLADDRALIVKKNDDVIKEYPIKRSTSSLKQVRTLTV